MINNLLINSFMRLLVDHNKFLAYSLSHDIVYEDIDNSLFSHTNDIKFILDNIYDYFYTLESLYGWSPSLAFHKDSCYLNLVETKNLDDFGEQSSIYYYSDAFECTLPYLFIFWLFILPLIIFYTLITFNLYKNRFLKKSRKLPYFYRYRHWANMRRYYLGSYFYHTYLTMNIWNSAYFFHSRGSSTLLKKSKFYSRNIKALHRSKRRRIETIMSWVRYYKHFNFANWYLNSLHNKNRIKYPIFFPLNFFSLLPIFLLTIIFKIFAKNSSIYYFVNNESLSNKDLHLLQKNCLIRVFMF